MSAFCEQAMIIGQNDQIKGMIDTAVNYFNTEKIFYPDGSL